MVVIEAVLEIWGMVMEEVYGKKVLEAFHKDNRLRADLRDKVLEMEKKFKQ